MILKTSRMQLLNSIKQTPKNLGNTSILKLNTLKKIGDLKKKDEHGNNVICSSAETKADTLCEFFSSVFCTETDDKFEP